MDLKNFICPVQFQVMLTGMKGEEASHFNGAFNRIKGIIEKMPKTYETDGQKNPVAHLHYFKGGMDWWIIELDSETEQLQAFGYADLGMGGGELGYISIQELMENNIELDLHFKPEPIKDIIKKRGRV